MNANAPRAKRAGKHVKCLESLPVALEPMSRRFSLAHACCHARPVCTAAETRSIRGRGVPTTKRAAGEEAVSAAAGGGGVTSRTSPASEASLARPGPESGFSTQYWPSLAWAGRPAKREAQKKDPGTRAHTIPPYALRS